MSYDHSRSPFLMSRKNSAMLVIDVQEKLVPHIVDHQRVVWNIRRLIDAARLLSIPVFGTEQYPRGLGATVRELAQKLDRLSEKRMFSCRECTDVWREVGNSGVQNLIVVGIETHVCVQQTVLDSIAAGFGVFVPVDAVSSRFLLDHQTAVSRMNASGATITTTEAAIFEWCETSKAPEFREISRLIQEIPPR